MGMNELAVSRNDVECLTCWISLVKSKGKKAGRLEGNYLSDGKDNDDSQDKIMKILIGF